ncbi:MAG: M16 family metallopeptidase [Inhella sp.]
MASSTLRALLGALSLTFLAAATAAPLAPVRTVEGITEYRLPNGLQVLLAPDASKPTTTVNVTYRVGSKHENYGETGMAHLLEHLIFKGTPKHPNVWADFAKRGLAANGTTWFDRTNYYASFSANPDTLKWYLGWQADAMVNSFIAKKDLDTEMTVVRNEMEMGENSPGNIVFERLFATMFQWHNYAKSTIGARTDVENVDIGRLQAFYRLHYQPDNATLIVTGQFDPAQTLGWIQSSFGPLKKSPRPRPKLYTLDPVQDGERSVTVRRTGGTPSATVAYHVPASSHPDFAAVELITLLMTEAPSGRLHKRLVEDQKIASGVSGFAAALAEPGALLLGADTQPGGDPEALSKAMLPVVEGVAAQPFTQAELDRAKTRWLNRWDKLFGDPQQVGTALSEAIAAGDWRLFFLLRDRVKAATLADVNRVASERLLPANRTLALYVPTEKPERAPTPETVDVAAQLKAFVPQAAQVSAAAFDTRPAAIESATQRLSLPSGTRLALLPKPTRGGQVSGRATLRFGNLDALRGQRATTDLLAMVLDKGTLTLDRQQLRDRLDALKVELQIVSGTSVVSVGWTTTREHAAEASALVLQMLREPRLDAAVLEEMRAQSLTGLDASKDEPEAIAGNTLNRLRNAHPEGDPRNERTFDAMRAELQAVTLDGVRNAHRRLYGPQALTLAMVGDFDAGAVRAAVEKGVAPWSGALAHERLPEPYQDFPAADLRLRTPDKQNATVMVALSVPLNDSDPQYAALTLADYILGSNTDSRLWVRIREREGLSYGTYSSIDWSTFEPASTWVFGAIFAPQNRPRVEKALKEEFARALKDGFTAQELTNAKRALLNYRRLSRAQDGGLAGSLAQPSDLGRTLARTAEVDAQLAAATLQQDNDALRRHLRLDAMQIVWAGDFKDEAAGAK